MYNESAKVYSNSIVLGTNLVTKLANGIIFRDLNVPNILELKYSTQNKKISYHVVANDTEGIGSVKVILKDFYWESFDLQAIIGNACDGSVKIQKGGLVSFYIQVQDINGNNYETEIFIINIPVIVIEIGLIVGVIFLTGIISTTGYLTFKKRLLKQKKE